MSAEETAPTSSSTGPPAPRVVEYDPITGVPSEFNECLPKDSPEYKRWQAHLTGSLDSLSLKEGGDAAAGSSSTGTGDAGCVAGGTGGPTSSGTTDGAAAAAAGAADAAAAGTEKKASKKKGKGSSKPSILVEMAIRNKKKSTTIVNGLELFGLKLSEASKTFGKKFACGCSVTKTPTGGEQIEMQGDFLTEFQLPELIIKQFGKSHNITAEDIYFLDPESKKRLSFATDAGGDSDDGGD